MGRVTALAACLLVLTVAVGAAAEAVSAAAWSVDGSWHLRHLLQQPDCTARVVGGVDAQVQMACLQRALRPPDYASPFWHPRAALATATFSLPLLPSPCSAAATLIWCQSV